MKNATDAASFAERLVGLMRAKGYVSTGSRSGVDVTALSKAAETTYEMARRYCEGKAIPRADKLTRIADWLGVSPSELLYGDQPRPAESRLIHTEVLQSCIEAAKRAETIAGKEMPAEKTAKLVALLYEEAIDGREMNEGLIARLTRFL